MMILIHKICIALSGFGRLNMVDRVIKLRAEILLKGGKAGDKINQHSPPSLKNSLSSTLGILGIQSCRGEMLPVRGGSPEPIVQTIVQNKML